MIIGPAEYGKYRVPCQILMERAGVEEMNVTQIDLRPNGEIVITLLCRDTTGKPVLRGDELMTWEVRVP